MTKIKTKNIKQSLLWGNDKGTVCGRRVVVIFFKYVFLWHSAINVYVHCLKNIHLKETIILHLPEKAYREMGDLDEVRGELTASCQTS